MSERDPSGLDPQSPGAKLDNGKVMAGQILGQFPRALTAIAEVGTFGAVKYTLGGWMHVTNGINRYEDAGFRHWLKRMTGELVDMDSKSLHLAQEAWNKLAVLELTLQKMEQEQGTAKVHTQRHEHPVPPENIKTYSA